MSNQTLPNQKKKKNEKQLFVPKRFVYFIFIHIKKRLKKKLICVIVD